MASASIENAKIVMSQKKVGREKNFSPALATRMFSIVEKIVKKLTGSFIEKSASLRTKNDCTRACDVACYLL